jgi:IclR family transcriptional regulator, KDG regulon repressor
MSLHLVKLSNTKSRPMKQSSESTGVQAVLYALQILEHLAEQREPIGVTALAEHFASNKSKIFRHLKTLEKQGYVVQDEASERYRIGARLIALGHSINSSVDIVREAAPVMRKVRNSLNLSVVLSMLDSDGVRVVSVESGTSAVEITVKPGSLMDYHASAQGKIALAYGSQTLIKQAIKKGLKKHTPATITDPHTLEKELKVILKQGWAVAPDESVTGLNALAAPIFDASAKLVGSIAIVDSLQFIPKKPSTQQITALVNAGLTISENIGFRSGQSIRIA